MLAVSLVSGQHNNHHRRPYYRGGPQQPPIRPPYPADLGAPVPTEPEPVYEPSPCALIIPGLGKSSAADRFNHAKYLFFSLKLFK